jgi:hypothetical protein
VSGAVNYIDVSGFFYIVVQIQLLLAMVYAAVAIFGQICTPKAMERNLVAM